MTIWANCIVHNEENFIWFVLMGVVDYVDKILVWDTGSTDKTVEIIKEAIKAKGDKISFQQAGPVDKFQFPLVRQKMLEKSRCDWILVLDGDEVWWQDSINKVVNTIQDQEDKIDGIVVPMILPIGDIYHFQENSAGKYKILGRKGHFNLRAINKNIPGLHVDLPYGKESYFDSSGRSIQERKKIVFLGAPYLHVTHLIRSAKARKKNKYKLEIGKYFEKDFKYPDVFYSPYPKVVPNPWHKMPPLDFAVSNVLTPLRKIKRSFFDK